MKRLLSLAVAAAVAASLASCGDDETASPQEAASTVTVPDTTGQPAQTAKRRIRAAGPTLAVQFAEEPDSPRGCTVSDQDRTGEVDPNATVTLTLRCEVEVPNVAGEPAEDAQLSIEASGELTASFKDEPANLIDCTVSSQKPEGGARVDADTDVALTLKCEDETPDSLDDGPAADESDPADEAPSTEGGSEDQGDNCEPGYDPCLKADSEDYDCEGGSGNGPDYTGQVTVTGEDRFELDEDGDGSGCDP